MEVDVWACVSSIDGGPELMLHPDADPELFPELAGESLLLSLSGLDLAAGSHEFGIAARLAGSE